MRFLILLLLIYLGYRILRGSRSAELAGRQETATETFRDPVCGVYLSEADAVVGNLEGKRYHFCSMECLKQFEKMQQSNN